jgi:hypothetical protein
MCKTLSFTFNYDLSWGDHVRTVCRKIYGALPGLRKLVVVTPFAVRLLPIVARVISFFLSL